MQVVFGHEEAPKPDDDDDDDDDLGAATNGRAALLSKLPLLSPNSVCVPQFMEEGEEFINGVIEDELLLLFI